MLTLYLITGARNGSVGVELLTQHGWRLPGLTRKDCDAIGSDRDEMTVAVQWNGTSFVSVASVAALVSNSTEVALRIYLRNAQLFGVTLKWDASNEQVLQEQVVGISVAIQRLWSSAAALSYR